MRLLRRLARGLLYSVLVATTLLLLTVLALRWVDPPTSAFMIEASLTALRAGEHDYATHYQWVDLEQISPQAALAVIASEDQQFPFHGGFAFQLFSGGLPLNSTARHVSRARPAYQPLATKLFPVPGR